MNDKKQALMDIHADDYAVSVHASKDILALLRNNKLNSISIIPNFPCFDECLDLLREYFEEENKGVNVSIHLNLMEGVACSKVQSVSRLVDGEGRFIASWGSLLLQSVNPVEYRIVKEQIKMELGAQIEKVRRSLPEYYPLRIDSHQHTHVIPIVFDALSELILEENLSVEFLRIPREPLMPHIRQKKLWHTYSLVNLIKHVLLNVLSILAEKKLKKKHASIQYGMLWGVLMSGCMDETRVKKIMSDMKKYAFEKNTSLEVLFHPGTVEKTEITGEYSKHGFVEFHLSPNRGKEWIAVNSLK